MRSWMPRSASLGPVETVRHVSPTAEQGVAGPGTPALAQRRVVAIRTVAPQLFRAARPREREFLRGGPDLLQRAVANVPAHVRCARQRWTSLDVPIRLDSQHADARATPLPWGRTEHMLPGTEIAQVVCDLDLEVSRLPPAAMAPRRERVRASGRAAAATGPVGRTPHGSGQLDLPGQDARIHQPFRQGLRLPGCWLTWQCCTPRGRPAAHAPGRRRRPSTTPERHAGCHASARARRWRPPVLPDQHPALHGPSLRPHLAHPWSSCSVRPARRWPGRRRANGAPGRPRHR